MPFKLATDAHGRTELNLVNTESALQNSTPVRSAGLTGQAGQAPEE